MQLKKGHYAIVDSIHIYDHKKFKTKESTKLKNMSVVEHIHTHQLYFLIKKGEEYNSNTKYNFINYLEKSFDLIHPALIDISGYSIDKTYIYYKYTKEPLTIDNVRLTDENTQKILIGIVSGLSYLISRGYYYPTFSINTIIFDKKICPKMLDYINFGDSNKGSEKDLVNKFVDIMKIIFDKKRNQENGSNFVLHEDLTSLIERCKQDSNIPTLNDFYKFFKKTSSFKDNPDIIILSPYKKYLDIIHLHDKITYDDITSQQYKEEYKMFDSIEQICYYFFIKRDMKELSDDDIYLLNSLPEYYIKPFVKFLLPLKEKLIRYLYNEDITLIIPNWHTICDKNSKENPFSIYKILMTKMKALEKQKEGIIYFDKERKDIDYQIDALRIQAIHFLKEASKQKVVEAQIELAVQYVRGYILPYNISKALRKLNEIDLKSTKIKKDTKILVNQMIERINGTIDNTSIEKIKLKLNKKQKDAVIKAQQGHVLSMIYVGFSFFTGFNEFPVIHSLSIFFYKEAAKRSADAMALLGYLYFRGIFFPHNLKKARKYFRLAAENGCIKAEIIDSIIRKHVWRSYLVDFDVNELFSYYLQSDNLNDAYQFIKMNYNLENNLNNDRLFKLVIHREINKEKLDYTLTNCSTPILSEEIKKWRKNINVEFSEKIVLSSKNIANIDDVDTLKFLAKSYFNGDNEFPVNYKKAALFYKLAADKNDSESQWKYAMLCYNSIGGDKSDADYYFRESAQQNNLKGKFYYSIYLINEKPTVRPSNIAFNDINENRTETNVFHNIDVISVDDDYNTSGSFYFSDNNNDENSIHSDHSILRKKEITAKHRENFDFLQNENLSKLFLKDCVDTKDVDAMYYYALINQDPKDEYKLSAKYYRKGIKRGHFNSLIRLNNIYRTCYENFIIECYFLYTPGILNEKYLAKTINYYDDKNQYDQSNIIIQIGIRLNPQLFNFYYADHLLYGKDVEQNIERAKKLAILAFKENYPLIYREKYIYLMLQILVVNNEYNNALNFLFMHKNDLSSKHYRLFHEFYKRFPRYLAQEYFIPACFCYKEYRTCHDALMNFHDKKANLMTTLNLLLKYVKEDKNPFAMAILGKVYKMEKYIIRDLESSIQYSARSASYKCPLGCYYIGKEYFYGRYLDQNYKKALEQLNIAIELNGEPRAGYYIFIISERLNDQSKKSIDMLKIAAEFKHKRSLFLYGYLLFTGKDCRVARNEKKGLKLILEAYKLHYSKAKNFRNRNIFTLKKAKKNIEANKQQNEEEEEKREPIKMHSIINDDESSNDFCFIKLTESAKSSDVIPIKHDKSSESCSLSSSFNGNDNDNNNKNSDIKNSRKETNNSNTNNLELSINEDEDNISDLFAFWF